MKSFKSRIAAVGFACALVAGLLAGIPAAFALDAGVYTAPFTSSYANPDTGEIEDSGGSSNEALGTSMVAGISQPDALVEVTAQGDIEVTVRFGQGNALGDVRVAFDETKSGKFGDEVTAEMVKLDDAENKADFRFTTPSEKATMRISMFVEPMGRDVVFFATLGTPVAGDTAGFGASQQNSAASAGMASSASAGTASSASSQAASSSAPASSASASAANASSPSAVSASSSAAATSSSSASSSAVESSSASSAASATSSSVSSNGSTASSGSAANSSSSGSAGAKEYNADGNEVKKNAPAQLDDSSITTIVIIAAVVVVAIVLLAYLFIVRPKRAAELKAAQQAAKRTDRK